jgi:hypothetical protein
MDAGRLAVWDDDRRDRHPARRQRLRIEGAGGFVSGQGEKNGQRYHRKLRVHGDLLFFGRTEIRCSMVRTSAANMDQSL